MNLVLNLPVAIWRWLAQLGAGLCSVLWLATRLLSMLRTPGGLGAAASDLETQRHGFAVLRAFQPNLVLGRILVKSYPNTGTVIVSRQRRGRPHRRRRHAVPGAPAGRMGRSLGRRPPQGVADGTS